MCQEAGSDTYAMPTFTQFIGWLQGSTTPSPTWLSVALLLLGVTIAVPARIWRRTRLLATWVHEGAHALVAIIFGRRVLAIRIEGDTSGTTEHAGRKGGLGVFLSAVAGYPGPSLFGFFLATFTIDGTPRWAVLVMAIAGLVLTLFQRTGRGFLVSLVWLALTAALAVLPMAIASAVLLVLSGYLFTASPRTIIELRITRARAKRENAPRHSDADSLALMTGLPAVLWEAVFLGLSLILTWQTAAHLFPGVIHKLW